MWEGDVLRVECPTWTDLISMAGLDETVLRTKCRRRRLHRGEVVFHEGDPAGAFHMIDKGRVAIRLTTRAGDVATIDVLHEGDTFGEQAVARPTSACSATVAALEKVETLSLDAAEFEVLRCAHPRIDRFLLMVVSARLRATNQQLLEALYVPADERVPRCVVRLASIFISGSSGCIPLTQHDVATMAGVTRSTVNRLLRQAQRDRLIDVHRSQISVIHEPADAKPASCLISDCASLARGPGPARSNSPAVQISIVQTGAQSSSCCAGQRPLDLNRRQRGHGAKRIATTVVALRHEPGASSTSFPNTDSGWKTLTAIVSECS